MAYMARESRRAEILDAVVTIAATEGFAAASVRRVAGALSIAVGNIHHIFESASDLKREAFRHFVGQEFAAMDAAGAGESRERLIPYLCVVADARSAAGIHVWREALTEAARDEAFGEVYGEAMQTWHQRIVALLDDATRSTAQAAALADSAWRLMAFSSGLAGFSRIPRLPVASGDMVVHVRAMIDHETTGLVAQQVTS